MEQWQAWLEWFRSLPDPLRVAILAFVAERLTQYLKLAAQHAGWIVPADKLRKMLLAVLGAAATAVVTAGWGPEFWGAAATALLSAAFLHEAGANIQRALSLEGAVAKEVQRAHKLAAAGKIVGLAMDAPAEQVRAKVRALVLRRLERTYGFDNAEARVLKAVDDALAA